MPWIISKEFLYYSVTVYKQTIKKIFKKETQNKSYMYSSFTEDKDYYQYIIYNKYI